MAEFFDALTEKHIEMMAQQPVFFVATAAADGRVNVSPKGYNSLRVLSPTRVAYLDLAGSGNETHAHLAATDEGHGGRVTLMLCNFQRPAVILRLYGHGRAVLPQDAEWETLAEHFTLMPGTRQIFDIAIDTVQTSCGWGVPFMALEAERPTLKKAHAQMDPAQWVAMASLATQSIDGLPTRPTDRYISGDDTA